MDICTHLLTYSKNMRTQLKLLSSTNILREHVYLAETVSSTNILREHVYLAETVSSTSILKERVNFAETV